MSDGDSDWLELSTGWKFRVGGQCELGIRAVDCELVENLKGGDFGGDFELVESASWEFERWRFLEIPS